MSAAMERGELSYAKVRAVTRVATPDNEAQLLDVARAGTAAHVERIVRAWRRMDRLEAACLTEHRHQNRYLSMWVDEDGMLVIRGRLTPELGAVVQRAVEATADQLYRESAHSPDGDRLIDEGTPSQRRADALAHLAECALTADLDRCTSGDRYQVVVHVDTAALHANATSANSDSGQAVLELDDSPTYVSAETSRRLSCDSSIVLMHHTPDGSALSVGRKTRTIPSAIRRALAARDRHCQFPGCTGRRCDGHHITHWADGGPTRLDNLILLCRRHHRAVHEEGFSLERRRDGTIVFFQPDGARLDMAPALSCAERRTLLAPAFDHVATAGVSNPPGMVPPVWNGEPLDLAWAIDVLRSVDADAARDIAFFARQPGCPGNNTSQRSDLLSRRRINRQ
jgi:hypothetical protein